MATYNGIFQKIAADSQDFKRVGTTTSQVTNEISPFSYGNDNTLKQQGTQLLKINTPINISINAINTPVSYIARKKSCTIRMILINIKSVQSEKLTI